MHPGIRGPAPVSSVLFAVLGAALAGCVEVPDGAFQRPSATEARLEITDYRGEPADPDAVPRLPRLLARIDEPLTGEDEIAWLLRGSADAELLADLERSPLLAASRERAVPCASSLTEQGLELLPQSTLQPGAYTFAVAAWAIDRDAPLVLELEVSDTPESGASMTAAWPADGSTSVGTDLPLAWIAFDGQVERADQGVWLENATGLAIDARARSGPCDALGIAGQSGTCVVLEPRAWLAPLNQYRIVIGRELRDAHGAPIGPLAVAFRTGRGPDSIAPAPAARACALDETAFELGCALITDRTLELRIVANEPFAMTAHAGEQVWSAFAPSAETAFAIDGLRPGARVELSFELKDSTGNELAWQEAFRTHADLATLSITEVLANPLGAEPQQEWVELWNFGEQAIALDGLQLSDDAAKPGAMLATTTLLDPGARVLLVPDAFDTSAGSDVAIPAGTPLVRVGKALGSAGLANRGEPLFLRDRSGRRLSAAPSIVAPSAGSCIARVSEDPRDGSLGAFASDEIVRCTPGG